MIRIGLQFVAHKKGGGSALSAWARIVSRLLFTSLSNQSLESPEQHCSGLFFR